MGTPQSKKYSHYEVLTNQIVGIILGWSIVYFIFPFIGIPITKTDATISTVIFFIASYTRAYTIRRIFTRINK